VDVIALVEPEIAWNTGNAGRSCLAFGAKLHLVGPLGFSLDEKRVRRAGLDYWRHVDPVVHRDWEAFDERAASLPPTYFLSADAPRTLDEVEFAPSNTFVFGKESVGLDAALRERFADRLVRLPIVDDRIRSLNVSTCVGIVLYEAWRRRAASARE